MDDTVRDIVGKTREMLLPHWGAVEAQKKHGDGRGDSVVTELDRAVETYMRSELEKLDPGIHFAGEEFGGSREHERYWLCDPIDGTAHFIRGLPFCSVMLALVEDGRVTFSIIYDFVHDRMYHARRGAGAYMNTDRISVSERPLSDAYVSFETRSERPENAALFERLRGGCMVFNSITSGFEFALVASGKFEGRICLDPYGKDFDFLPGTLLVEEAGGRVTNIGSTTYDIANLNLIAANPLVHAALTEGEGAIFPISR